MGPPLEPLLLSTTSVPYLLPVFLLLFFLLAARTSPYRLRGSTVGYNATGNANCSWSHSTEDTSNNVGPADARIRGMVEQTVEAILPGPPNDDIAVDGGLDDASVERHPAYGCVYERHEPALAAALVSLQRALLDGVDANTAATKLAALVRALGSDSQVTATTISKTTTQHLPPSPTPLHDRTYEDILATAIVNKVIERCQQQKLLVPPPEAQSDSQRRRRRRVRERSARASSDSLSRSPSPCERPSSRSFISSLEVRLGASGVSGSSGSGCSATSAASGELDESDEWSEPLALKVEETLEETTLSTVLSDDSDVDEKGLRKHPGRPEHADKLDFFLCGINFLNKKNRVPFPEFGADIIDVDIDSEGSDVDGSLDGVADDEKEREGEEEEDVPATVVQIAAPIGSWEDNWLFQSRRLKTPSRGHQPVPVPMLVPNPSQDLRPLIGDVDAEETSDLSECSDDAIQDVVLAEGEGSSLWGDDDDDIAEACNAHLLQQAATDKDSELTVLYAAPDRRPAPAPRTSTPLGDRDDDSGQASLESTCVHAETIKVSTDVTASAPTPEPTPPVNYTPIPAPRPTISVESRQLNANLPSNTSSQPANEPTAESIDLKKGSDCDPEMSGPPRPGTIAAREHEKWQHAVPLANNPYSPENIERRLRQRGRPIDLPDMSNVDRLDSSTLSTGNAETGDSQRIHISIGSLPDPRRYSRDFYVNTDPDGRRDSTNLDRGKPPNGMKPRAGRGQGLQEKIIIGDVRTSGDGHRGPDEESISLPSVKELARHFVGEQAGLADKNCPTWCPDDSATFYGRNIPERKVVIVDLESRNHQVHSLTARSMPRAFREGLRHSSPPVTPVRVSASPKSGERPDPEGAGANDTTRR